MTTQQIKDRIAYWNSRSCYRHAAQWKELLERSTVQVIRSAHTAEPRINTLNNGGQ